MTEEQQRIAIAEACGWKLVEDHPYYEPYWEDQGHMVGVSINGHRFPDYLNDLNVMHDATMILGIQQLCEMADWLHQITGFYTRIFHATAAQRAEAFLRTIGKWEEAQ